MTVLSTLQGIAHDWGVRCFGQDHMDNKAIRALRFAEEAIELVQVCEVPEEKMRELVRIVYSRPVGTPIQEVGGCMVTLSVLVHVLQIDLEWAFETEICRCLKKTPAEFAARNAEKIGLGLDA